MSCAARATRRPSSWTASPACGGATAAAGRRVQLLIEEATGRPFADVLRDLVLEPAGMTTATFEQPPSERLHPLLAEGTDAEETPITGGWHVYRLDAGEEAFVRASVPEPRALPARPGQQDGTGVVVMASSNAAGPLINAVVNAVAQAQAWPDFAVPPAAAAALLAGYAGPWLLDDGREVRVEATAVGLVLHLPGQRPLPLSPTSRPCGAPVSAWGSTSPRPVRTGARRR